MMDMASFIKTVITDTVTQLSRKLPEAPETSSRVVDRSVQQSMELKREVGLISNQLGRWVGDSRQTQQQRI